MTASHQSRPGQAVDASGGPVVDPTANVIALNDASSRRLDDLRDAQDKQVQSNVDHLKELLAVQADHAREVRAIETARIDANRQVDILNQSAIAERQQAAILALERTTQSSADTLRAMVDSTAKTLAAQHSIMMDAVNARLAALEKSNYEGKGKGVGLNAGWLYLLGGLSLIGTLLGFVSFIG